MACLAVLDILYSTQLTQTHHGPLNTPNPSLSDPTLSYMSGLGRGGGGEFKGGLVGFKVGLG